MKESSLSLRTRWISIVFQGVILLSASTRSHAEDVPFVREENGPFMVLARTFRGPDAEDVAKALATELIKEHKLSAYLYRASLKGVNPGIPIGMHRIEEVAVLVGDAKSQKEQEALLKQVKRINPRCLADRPYPLQILPRETRLARAVRTKNPLLRLK